MTVIPQTLTKNNQRQEKGDKLSPYPEPLGNPKLLGI